MPVIINGSTGISGTDGSAATPALQGTDTNTGMYFPGADRIGFAEGGVQVGEFDASGNFLFNSGYGSVAVAYGCRAWVNFNGTGTVAIRASGNVSSITDNGPGNYAVNFTNSMPDANFACQISIGPSITGFVANVAERHITGTFTTSSAAFTTADVATGLRDTEQASVAIFR
jgi:hypothetical protein